MLVVENILEETAHVDSNTVLYTATTGHVFAYFYPPGQREVHSFGDVEAIVEAGMVTLGSSDHEFAFSLNHFADFNAMVKENLGVDKGGFMSDVVRALFEVLGEFGPDEFFELLVIVNIH